MHESVSQHIVPIAVTIFLLLALFGGFLLPCFVARYAPQVRALLLSFVGIFYTPIHTAAQWLRRCITTGRSWLRNQIAGFSADGNTDKAVSYVIGSILYAIFGCFLVACEIPLAALTLEAWGFDGITEKFAALTIMDAGICIATAAILSSVAWGALLFDALGTTHFAPFIHKFKKRGQMAMVVLCSVGFLVSVAGLWAMAYYRGEITRGSIMDVLVPPASAAVNSPPNEDGEADSVAPAELTDFEAMAAAKVNGAMAADSAIEPTEEALLPKVSPFAAKLPIIVFTATAINMAALSAITLTAGSSLLLWLTLGLFFVALIPFGIGFGVFHAVDLVLDRIAENMLRLLELLIEYGSSILRRMGIEPGGNATTPTTGNSAATPETEPASPPPGNQEGAAPAEEARTSTGPHSTNGFDPFAGAVS